MSAPLHAHRPYATIAVLVVVAGLALVTGTWSHSLAPDLLDRFGCAPADLRAGSWWRLASAAFLSRGPASLPRVVFLVALAGIWYERRHGAWRMLILAVVADVAVQGLAAGVLGRLGGWAWSVALDTTRDVGPSVGFYALLGALLLDGPRSPHLEGRGRAGFVHRWRRTALLGGMAAMSVINVGWHLAHRQAGALEGDIEHVLAIGCGFALGAALLRRRSAACA